MLSVVGKQMKLSFKSGWLDKHPLTREDLELEAGYVAAAGFKLRAS